jgi:hypothetical protein
MQDQKVKTSTFSDAAEGTAFAGAYDYKMIDLAACTEIEFLVDSNGRKVWMNIDGKCAVRVGEATHIVITMMGAVAEERHKVAPPEVIGDAAS